MMDGVKLSYAAPQRRKDVDLIPSIVSVVCWLVPVTGFVMQYLPLFLGGLLLLPVGLGLGVYGILVNRALALGIVGTTLNGVTLGYAGFVLVLYGLC